MKSAAWTMVTSRFQDTLLYIIFHNGFIRPSTNLNIRVSLNVISRKYQLVSLQKKSKPSFNFCYHLPFLCYVHTFTYASTQTTRIHNVHITNTLTHQHRLLQWLELDIFRFFVFVWWLVNNYTYNNGYRMFSKLYWKGSSFLSVRFNKRVSEVEKCYLLLEVVMVSMALFFERFP